LPNRLGCVSLLSDVVQIFDQRQLGLVWVHFLSLQCYDQAFYVRKNLFWTKIYFGLFWEKKNVNKRTLV
jgi:hypothetical protein